MKKDWLDERARTSTRGLKKTGENEWFDPVSRQLFTKKNGKLQMKVDPWNRAQHKRTMERFRYYENKFGVDLSDEKKAEKNRWKYYLKGIEQFNKGEFARPSTVQRREQSWQEMTFKKGRYFSPENKALKSQLEERRKVTIMRIAGKHDIYNGLAYDRMIEAIANSLEMSPEELESTIFPTLTQEKSIYEPLKKAVDNSEKSLDELVDELVKNGLDENKGEHAKNLFNQVM